MVSVSANESHFYTSELSPGGKSTGSTALWASAQTAMRSKPVEEDAWCGPTDKQWFLPCILGVYWEQVWSITVLWVWVFTWSALQTQIWTLSLNAWCAFFKKMLVFKVICLCYVIVSVKIGIFGYLPSHRMSYKWPCSKVVVWAFADIAVALATMEEEA